MYEDRGASGVGRRVRPTTQQGKKTPVPEREQVLALKRIVKGGLSRMSKTITPTELAVQLWGRSEDFSRSAGARRIRVVARDLFPAEAPGKGGEWHLTPEQVTRIKAEL
jgi:hypothetical protein